MKESKLTYWGLLIGCVVYFISRISCEIFHTEILNRVSIALSIVIGSVMFSISLKIFFYDKKKKEALQALIISIVLICISYIG